MLAHLVRFSIRFYGIVIAIAFGIAIATPLQFTFTNLQERHERVGYRGAKSIPIKVQVHQLGSSITFK